MSFKFSWGLVFEGGLSAAGVVVEVDVGDEFDPGVGRVDEGTVLQHLRFQGAHEGFGLGIVIGIGPRGHALADVACLGSRRY